MKRFVAVIGLASVLCLIGCDKARSLVKQALRNAASEEGEVGEITILTSSTYDDFEKQGERLVVVDFYADWCGSCRKLEPILARVSNDFSGKAVVGKVNVARQKEIAKQKGIDQLPDIRFYLDGKQVDRMVGPGTEPELRKRFEIHTAKVMAQLAAGEGGGVPREEVKPLSEGWLPPGMEKAKPGDNPLAK